MEVRNRLTELACEAIHKALDDYEEKIIKEAYSIAVQNSTEMEISLNNVHDAVKNLQKRIEKKAILEEEQNERIKDGLKYINTIREKRKERRFQFIISSMTLVGMVYIFMGLFYQFKPIDFRDTRFLITMVGFVTVITSYFISYILKYGRVNIEERRIESQKYNDLILQLWSQIDYYGKELWSDYLVNNVSKISKDEIENINSSIDLINRLLDSGELEKFSKLIAVRNKIVHGDYKTIHIQEKEEVIIIADNIIDKLKGMVKHENPNAAID